MKYQKQTINNLGFTIIELIVVMVVLGVLGVMGAGFISESFRGFQDTDVRMQIFEEGKTTLFRMERELHIALPNAIDISGNTISFGVIGLLKWRTIRSYG